MTGEPYVVEVETSTHDALKAGILASARGLTGSRYRSAGAPDSETADKSSYRTPTVVSGPRFTTVVVSDVDSDAEAVCVAAQIAASTSDAMPTRAVLISWPTEDSP